MSDRLELLRAKLKARTGKHEYRENVKFLQAEIEKLEATAKPGEKK